MKKLLASLLFLPLILSAQTNSYIQFLHFTAGWGNLTCNPTGSNYVATASIGDGTAVITWASASNCWVVSGLSPAGVIISPANVWITNTAYWAYGDRYPTNGTVCQVYGDQSGLITNNISGVSTMTFFNFAAPTVTNWATVSTNYWSAPGDLVYFSGSGRNMSSGANGNRLVVSIDGNPVFTGPYTAGSGLGWRVAGSVQWDGTNFLSTGQFVSGDTNIPNGYDIELVTNVSVGRNAWQWSVLGDTNGLTFDNASIVASRAPSGDLPQHSFVSGNTSAAAATIVITNAITGAPGTSVIVTNIGTSIAAVLQFTIPSGQPGTNSVTVNQFSNVVLSSQQLTTYTNFYAYWGASNFLARVNGLYRWVAYGGDDGGNPPGSIPVSLVGSYNGTTGWFAITNGFQTTNWISVALVTNGYSMFGGRQVNPGAAALYSIDHWELLGRTNFFFGQHQRFDSPSDPNDAATKGYVDGVVANGNAQFPGTTDSNFVNHTVYTVAGVGVFDTPQTTVFVPIAGSALDGTGTNLLMSIVATNLTAGWKLQSSTNLTLLYGWQTYTNFSTNIVSGTNIFTIPVNPALPMMFFRILKSSSTGFTVTPILTASAGTLYPSNVWNLAAITNGMPNFSFWTGNSNGQALVTLSLSNGVVRYLQALH